MKIFFLCTLGLIWYGVYRIRVYVRTACSGRKPDSDSQGVIPFIKVPYKPCQGQDALRIQGQIIPDLPSCATPSKALQTNPILDQYTVVQAQVHQPTSLNNPKVTDSDQLLDLMESDDLQSSIKLAELLQNRKP